MKKLIKKILRLVFVKRQKPQKISGCNNAAYQTDVNNTPYPRRQTDANAPIITNHTTV